MGGIENNGDTDKKGDRTVEEPQLGPDLQCCSGNEFAKNRQLSIDV